MNTPRNQLPHDQNATVPARLATVLVIRARPCIRIGGWLQH